MKIETEESTIQQAIQSPTKSGAPFYFLDGPLVGSIINGDFRRSIHDGIEYSKATYAAMVNRNGFEYRVICDVAYSGNLPETLPISATGNVWIEKNDPNAPDIVLEDDLLTSIGILSTRGNIERIIESGLSPQDLDPRNMPSPDDRIVCDPINFWIAREDDDSMTHIAAVLDREDMLVAADRLDDIGLNHVAKFLRYMLETGNSIYQPPEKRLHRFAIFEDCNCGICKHLKIKHSEHERPPHIELGVHGLSAFDRP